MPLDDQDLDSFALTVQWRGPRAEIHTTPRDAAPAFTAQ